MKTSYQYQLFTYVNKNKTVAFVYFLNLHSRLDMSAPKQPKNLLCNVKYIESIQKVVDLFPTNWSIEKNAQMRILFVWVSENESWLYSGWPDFQLLDM